METRLLLAASDLDLSFGGGDGAVTGGFKEINVGSAVGWGVAVRPDGKILVAGDSGSGSNLSDRVSVTRFTADGALDPTFDGDGDADGKVAWSLGGVDSDTRAIALQTDGKIIVAGRTQYLAGSTRDWMVVRLNENGSIDPTFGGGDGIVTINFGSGAIDEAFSVAVQGDGKIVLAGQVSQATMNMAVARLNADGTLDDSSDGSGFSGDGMDVVDCFGGSYDMAYDVSIDPDGKIVVAGTSAPSSSGRGRAVLLRYLPDGTLDTTFDGDGLAWTDFRFGAMGRQVLRQPDGKYVIGGLAGWTTTATNSPAYTLARFTSGGALDSTFGNDPARPGRVILDDVLGSDGSSFGLVRQADGRLLFGGNANSSSKSYFGAARVSADGVPDSSFGNGGVRMFDFPGGTPGSNFGTDVALAGDGNILITGGAYPQRYDVGLLKLKASDVIMPGEATLGGDGTLTVTGTDLDDVLSVSAAAGTITVLLNGTTYAFPAGSVTSIDVDLENGSDTATLDGPVPGGRVALGIGHDALTVGAGGSADSPLTVDGGEGNDTVTLANGFTTATSFTGGLGTDTLTYNGGDGADDLLVTDTQVTNRGLSPATYASLEFVNVLADGGADVIRFRTAAPSVFYALDGGDQDDRLLVGGPGEPEIPSSLETLSGGAGDDEIVIDDSANPRNYNYNYQLTLSTFQREFLVTCTFQTAETVRLITAPNATASSTVSVQPSSTTRFVIDGGAAGAAPGDAITVNVASPVGSTFEPLGPGAGRYTFTYHRPVEYQHIERDLTAVKVALTAAQFQYATRQAVSFTFATDVRSSLQVGDLVLKNLTTGQTVPTASLALTLTGAAGTPTTGTWAVTGGALPDGNYVATLPRTSIGATTDQWPAVDYQVSFFVLAGDANHDRVVNFNDLLILASNYNKTGKTWSDGDFNYDGVVNFDDLLRLAQHYNTSLSAPPSAAPALASEPVLAAVVSSDVLSSESRKPVFSTTPVTRPVAPKAKPAPRPGRR